MALKLLRPILGATQCLDEKDEVVCLDLSIVTKSNTKQAHNLMRSPHPRSHEAYLERRRRVKLE
jgi:hypothetical protein